MLTACASADSPAAEPAQIEWFVGLGTGSDRLQVERQQPIVDSFNAAQQDIELTLTVVHNSVAQEVLAERVAAGDEPDIIGPIGRLGSATFGSEFLDLTSWIDDGTLDTNFYPPAQIESLRSPDRRLTGLPFGAFPAVIIANSDLFEAAGEPLPPTRFGEQYQGEVWDMEALRQLAMRLTFDAEGRSALDPSFDAGRIVQWGFNHQWLPDARSIGTFFGPGTLVADDGSAVIPDNWLASWEWHHQLIWKDRAAPTDREMQSQVLGSGNTMISNNMAMAFSHTWYLGSLKDDAGQAVTNIELAVPPEYEGAATSKLHTDTFRVLQTTQHPDEAIAVLAHLLGEAAPQLLDIYGSYPARTDLQGSFEAQVSESFPSMTTVSVIREALTQPDIPNHESAYPKMVEARPALVDFMTAVRDQPDLDVAAEADRIRIKLDELIAQPS